MTSWSNRTRAEQALTVVRVGVATMLIIHGTTRAIVTDGVTGFGGFLGSKGFPGGVIIAAVLTAVEIVGGLALAAGWRARWLALWFIAELLGGIALVHWPEGWFVVGGGRNGMEYSVVLIIMLASVAWASVAPAPRPS